MLFNFKRIRKIAGLVIFLMIALTLASFWEDISGAFSEVVDTGRRIIGLKEQAEEIEDSIDSLGGDDKGIDVDREITLATGEDELKIEVENAKSASEIRTGLMYRERMCEYCGMLFYFDEERIGGFWMKNCEMPLDILFIDSEGQIVDIKENFEPCRQESCPSYIPDFAYKYALEVNGGWVEDNDVEIGDEIEEL